MTPTEAARLLELPDHATPDQVEARFHELRTKLEEKIGKAPTPGLKAKYRESLDEITQAFETLALAADSSALPVLRREQGEGRKEQGGTPEAGGPASLRAGNGAAATPPRGAGYGKRKSGKEFVVVALIAIAVLGAGGWWVMKTRAENAEQARVAAEADRTAAAEKAAAEQVAAEQAAEQRHRIEQARVQAEQDKLAKETAAQAEREKQDRLGLQLRSRLTELGIQLEAVLKTETVAERELADLKAEERVLQREARGTTSPDLRAAQAAVAAHEKYCSWLRDNLAAHPARLSRAKLEELAGARAWGEVAAGIEAYVAGIKQLQADIATRRDEHLVLTGALNVSAEPAEVDFQLKDAYGRVRAGRTPAELDDVPLGPVTITFQRAGWPAVSRSAVVRRDAAATVSGDLVGGALSLTSVPFSADFVLQGQGRTERGRTPRTLDELPVGAYEVTFSRPGWPAQTLTAEVKRGGSDSKEASFTPPGSIKIETKPAGAAVSLGGTVMGTTPLTIADLPPGVWQGEVTLADYRPLALSGIVESGKETVISGALRSATLTPEEAFEKFAREAHGTWVHHGRNGLGGSASFYLRFVKGSRTLSFEQTGFGGSVRNMTMVEYDAASREVLITFGGLDALNGKLRIRMDGDTVLFGRDLQRNPMTFTRQ